jgi:predicted dehydrogenase
VRRFFDSELASKVRFVGATCLLGGSDEHRTNVIPYFSRYGISPPEYQKSLTAAIESTVGSSARRPAVIISTPNTQHADQILTALEHGCDVYVDRPIVTHLDPLPDIVDLAKRQRAILYTGVQRRTERAYRTIRWIALKRYEFTSAIAVRCTLRAGHALTGWRTNITNAGGGIVIDSGYHLLDFSAWLAHDLGFSAGAYRSCGASFMIDPAVGVTTRANIETTAIGHIEYSPAFKITFDFSYAAPINSVYERIEVNDSDGGRITLTRDQAARSDAPGLITHQRPDGSIVSLSENPSLAPSQVPQRGVPSRHPTARFLERCRTRAAPRSDPCEADASIPTWFMVKEVYNNAKWF